MTDRQEDKLTRYLTVEKVLDKFSAVWIGLVAFVAAVTDFKGVITAIGGDRQTQEKDTKGVTKDKERSREKLVVKTMKVIGALTAYATEAEDDELLEKINYTESELKDHTRDTILVDRCQLVHNEANAIVGLLGDHGVDATVLAELQGLIDDFKGKIPAPQVAIGDRSAATDSLEDNFDAGDLILENRLDKLMENFRTTEKDFYSEYHKARPIIERGHRTTNLTGRAVDAETGEGIEGVTVELVERGESTLTNNEGIYLFTTVPAGSDTLRASKPGWMDKEVPGVKIEQGVTTELDIELTREAPLAEEPAP